MDYEYGGRVVKLLTNKVFIWLGDISAPAFLLRQIIIGVVEMAGFNKPITAIIAFLITVADAKVYVLLEKYLLYKARRC